MALLNTDSDVDMRAARAGRRSSRRSVIWPSAADITTGRALRTGLTAEVLEGLEPGERVIAYPSDRVEAGTRIVAR